MHEGKLGFPRYSLKVLYPILEGFTPHWVKLPSDDLAPNLVKFGGIRAILGDH